MRGRAGAAAVLLTTVWTSDARAGPADATARALAAAWKDGDREMAAVAEVIARDLASGMSWAGTIEGHPLYCLMFRRLVNDAVRRDPTALKLLLPLIDRYAASPETELHLGELLAEDQAILSQYLREAAGPVSASAEESKIEGLGDGI